MKPVYLITILVFAAKIMFSQSETTTTITDAAYNEDFSKSIEIYKKLVLFDPNSPIFNYNLGYCYLNTAMREDSAIMYLLKARENYKKRPVKEIDELEIEFMIAKSYRINNQFDSAIIILETMKRLVTDDLLKSSLLNELVLAQSGQNNFGSEVKFRIFNIGEQINSSYSEHSPILSQDMNTLIFTSRKKNNLSDERSRDGQYDEDIYISYKKDNVWTDPLPISDKINTDDNEASISLSADGKILFIYRSEQRGSIYYSLLVNNQWSEPIRLKGNINTPARETHASISGDGNFLYFTSDRRGGVGGLDIYVSQREADGKWGKAKNLGKTINTKEDEDAPMISTDGEKLFFSSNGHGGFGGLDIFSSTKTNINTWTEAYNLGYPINSINDDIFYSQNNNSEIVMSSNRDGGFGRMDIYQMSFFSKLQDSLTIMSANVKACEKNLKNTIVNIRDNTTGKNYVATPNAKGNFIFVTYKGNNYNVTLSCNHIDVFYDNFEVPYNSAPRVEYKTIDLTHLEDCE